MQAQIYEVKQIKQIVTLCHTLTTQDVMLYVNEGPVALLIKAHFSCEETKACDHFPELIH